MVKNVGRADRSFRLLTGHILLLTGFWMLDGLHGNIAGIILTIIALVTFFMAIISSCIIFQLFKIHSLSRTELEVYGHPYRLH